MQSMSPFLLGLTSPRMKFSTSPSLRSGRELSASSNIIRSFSGLPRRPGVGIVLALAPTASHGADWSRDTRALRLGFLWLGDPAPNGRRFALTEGPFRGLLAPFGLQFSLSESPDGDWRMVEIFPSFKSGERGAELSCPCCRIALLDEVRLNRGFLPCCAWPVNGGALRFALFGWSMLLVDRSRLIAAAAEPVDSFSACVVNSSRLSESQHCTHARALRDLLRGKLGGKLSVRVEMGGKVTLAAAL